MIEPISENVTIVQGSKSPVFVGETNIGRNFLCNQCGMILVKNFVPHCYVGISFQCFECKSISKTPSLEPGEIIPQRCLRLEDNGRYTLDRSVIARPGVLMAVASEIEASKRSLITALSQVRPMNLDPSGIDGLADEYDRLSAGALNKQHSSYKRFPVKDHNCMEQFPFVWSIETIRRCLDKRVFNFDDAASNVALANLISFNKVVGRWSHHPRFLDVMSELRNGSAYFHTVGQFILAEYLVSSGNMIGFSSVGQQHGANPDLYMRFTGDEKFFIEVKSMSKLNWKEYSVQPNRSEVEKALRNLLKRGSQINKDRKGMVAIVSNMPPFSMADFMRKTLDDFFGSFGKCVGSMAGCVFVQWGGVERSPGDEMVTSKIEVTPVLNPHWRHGENPMKPLQEAKI